MPTDTPIPLPKRSRMPRGLWLGLLASLALNALVVGGLASAFWRHNGPLAGAAGTPNNIGAFIATLPGDRGRAVWARAAEKRRAMAPFRQEVRQARREALSALTVEPFDKERFTAAQTRLIDAEHRQRLAQRDVLAEVVGSMTPDERRAYIRWRGPPRQPGPPDEAETAPKQ